MKKRAPTNAKMNWKTSTQQKINNTPACPPARLSHSDGDGQENRRLFKPLASIR